MTKEEADAAIAAAKDAVVKAAIPVMADIRSRAVGSPNETPARWFYLNPLEGALRDLDRATEARAALDAPKLTDANEIIDQAYNAVRAYNRSAMAFAIGLAQADVMEKAEKLPKWGYNHTDQSLAVVGLGSLISLRDLRELVMKGDAQ